MYVLQPCFTYSIQNAKVKSGTQIQQKLSVVVYSIVLRLSVQISRLALLQLFKYVIVH